MSGDPRLDELRRLWAADWMAMKNGTYVPPSPASKRMCAFYERKRRVVTPEEAALNRSIAAAYSQGDKLDVICAEYGVTWHYVNKVVRGLHLPRRRIR